ncbi:VOC family protein [Novosphingobium resinovorum]|uniref:VOC family protein n=1 Tax=Novosphingobium resinovorum TaxID=158500 RepID=UPI002ED263A3|nr:VOC family protein [Novosphingobium resinovorum]
MPLKSVRLGSNDLDKSRAFYDATFAALGLAPSAPPGQHPIAMWDVDGVRFLLGPARDGAPCTHANGGTIIFEAADAEAVQAWHAAGLANGGTSEGAPEPKPQARGAFGAYLRDPDGNKLGVYAGLSMGAAARS